MTGRTICKVHFNCFLCQRKLFFLLSAHPYLIAVFFSLKSLNKISIPPVSFIEGSDWWVYIQVFYFHFLGMGLYLLIAMTILGWTTTNVLYIQTENLYKTSCKPILCRYGTVLETLAFTNLQKATLIAIPLGLAWIISPSTNYHWHDIKRKNCMLTI